MIRALVVALLAAAPGSSSAVAATVDDTTAAAAEPEGLAKLPVQERAEIEAVAAELARGLAGLRLEGSPEPYYATSRWVRGDLLSLEGSYGGVITNVSERQTAGLVQVRVGSPERDSSNYFGASSGTTRLAVALDPSPRYARKQTWLALDRAFRGATLAYTAKVTALEQIANKALAPDLSEGPVVRTTVSVQDAEAVDRAGLAAIVASLSGRFEAWPDIDNGDVHFQVLRSYETVVTSEGSILRRVRDRAVLGVVAETRAADGMALDHGLAIHFQGIPAADDALRAQGEQLVDQVLAELRELAAAPMIDEEYDGPILLSPQAAAQLLGSTVATEVSGNPAPWGDLGRLMELEPAWHKRVGKTVLPPTIDLVDDPTIDGFGSYAIDAEGFVPAPLTVVHEGKLEHLLMTRIPNDATAGSNGRGRLSPSLEVGPALSNLSLRSSRRGSTDKALERELMRRAQEDGYEQAYIIESLRDGTILGPVQRESAAAYAGTGKLTLPLPARLVRIDAQGKRTVIRGAVIAPASMRVLRRIRMVGQDAEITRMRMPVGTYGGFGAEVGLDGVLSQTVDVQIETPALLIQGLELLVERGEHEELPALVHPLRREPDSQPAKPGAETEASPNDGEPKSGQPD